MKLLLQEYTQYNVWANETICSFLRQLTPEQWNLSQASSFSSIRKTVDHMADCEFNWLKRLNGDSVWENKERLLGNDIPAVLAFWIFQSRQLADYIQQSEENQLMKIVSYKNIEGKPYETEVYRIIMHVMNHSTYHRGQLITLLRGAGFTSLSTTDLISFYRFEVNK